MNRRLTPRPFHFKQFSVVQEGCGMPVSTDGVLLGAWFECQAQSRLLDIGTGTGLLALMAAQRFSDITIDAIELDPQACQVARNNILQSSWTKRIQVYPQDILHYQVSEPYQAIVCNPPYFTAGPSAALTQRAVARHADGLTHHALLACCQRLLSDDGSASFILPILEANTMIADAEQQGWHLRRRCAVRSTTTKPMSRLLFELSKQSVESVQEQSLTIQHDNHYSAEFIQLTCDFYLKMASINDVIPQRKPL